MVSKVKDFLTDDGFIGYALGVSPNLVSWWEAYFKAHPEHIAAAEETKAVLLAPADVDCGLSADDYNGLKNRIVNSISSFQGIL